MRFISKNSLVVVLGELEGFDEYDDAKKEYYICRVSKESKESIKTIKLKNGIIHNLKCSDNSKSTIQVYGMYQGMSKIGISGDFFIEYEMSDRLKVIKQHQNEFSDSIRLSDFSKKRISGKKKLRMKNYKPMNRIITKDSSSLSFFENEGYYTTHEGYSKAYSNNIIIVKNNHQGKEIWTKKIWKNQSPGSNGFGGHQSFVANGNLYTFFLDHQENKGVPDDKAHVDWVTLSTKKSKYGYAMVIINLETGKTSKQQLFTCFEFGKGRWYIPMEKHGITNNGFVILAQEVFSKKRRIIEFLW